MVNGNRITYKFGRPGAYTLEFSESIRFQYDLDYHLLEDRQQVMIQLICHAMDQLAAGGEKGTSDRISVKRVDSQKDWELKDVNTPEKGYELKTSMYTYGRIYLYYDGLPVFGLSESSEYDYCITYLDHKYPIENWIDEVLELSLRQAECWGARTCLKTHKDQ